MTVIQFNCLVFYDYILNRLIKLYFFCTTLFKDNNSFKGDSEVTTKPRCASP